MIAIFAAAALTVTTQGQLGIEDSQLDACLQAQPRDQDSANYLTSCYSAAFGRVDAAVNAEQTRLIGELRKSRIPISPAIDAQNDWRRYRDSWCRVEGAGDPDPFGRQLTELQCRTEVTQRRLFRMRSAYQRRD